MVRNLPKKKIPDSDMMLFLKNEEERTFPSSFWKVVITLVSNQSKALQEK